MGNSVQLVKQERVNPNGPWAYKPISGVDESAGAQDALKVLLLGPDGKVHPSFLPPFLPPMGGQAGKFLTNDGTTSSWAPVFPALKSGKVLSNDGNQVTWIDPPTPLPPFSAVTDKYLKVENGTLLWSTPPSPLPSQSGKNGMFLTTDGFTLSWSNTPVYFQNPMTQKGDMIVGIDNGGGSRLGIGTNGQILTASNGMPVWMSPSSQFPSQTGNTGKFLTTNGSSVSWADTPKELPSMAGKVGMFLQTDGTNCAWVAVSALLPSQTGQAGKYLSTDGTQASWKTVDALPAQSGQGGKVLMTDGITASWATAPTGLPAQTGQSGKYLTTDGTTARWEAVSGVLPTQVGQGGKFLTTDGTTASWAAVPSGFQNPMTTKGDIITGLAGGTPTRLGIGAPGQVLGVTSTGDLAYIEGGSSGPGGPITDTLPNQTVQRVFIQSPGGSTTNTVTNPAPKPTEGMSVASTTITPKKMGNTIRIQTKVWGQNSSSWSALHGFLVVNGVVVQASFECEQTAAWPHEVHLTYVLTTTNLNPISVDFRAGSATAGTVTVSPISFMEIIEIDPAFQVNLSATRGSWLQHRNLNTPTTPQVIPAVAEGGTWLTFVDEDVIPKKVGATWKIDGYCDVVSSNISTTYLRILFNGAVVWSAGLASYLNGITHGQQMGVNYETPTTQAVNIKIQIRKDNSTSATLNPSSLYITEVDNATAIIPGQYGTQVVSLTPTRPWRGVLGADSLIKYNWGSDTKTTPLPGGAVTISQGARTGNTNVATWTKSFDKTKSVMLTMKIKLNVAGAYNGMGPVVSSADNQRRITISPTWDGTKYYTSQGVFDNSGTSRWFGSTLSPFPVDTTSYSGNIWYRLLYAPEIIGYGASKDGVSWEWGIVVTASHADWEFVRTGPTVNIGFLMNSCGAAFTGTIHHLEMDENLANYPVNIQKTYTIGADTATFTQVGDSLIGSVGTDAITSGTVTGPLAVLQMASGKRHTLLFEDDGSALYVSTFTP